MMTAFSFTSLISYKGYDGVDVSVTYLTLIQEVLGSNLDQTPAILTDMFRGFLNPSRQMD
jgi:hypothetical protein